jgi:cephalosporin-C deacetylase-like acetyl esterase
MGAYLRDSGLLARAPLIDEIDKILKKFPMYGNRQRFIETAIREKIEEVMQFK